MWVSQVFAVAAASPASGRVPLGLTLFDHAGRVAVLIDLALRSRVTLEAQASSVDTTPFGWEPVDAILAWIEANPQASMQRMIERAPVRLRDLVPAEAVLRRRGWPHRGEPILLEAPITSTKAAIVRVSESGHADTPALAAVALIADATNIAPTDHRTQLLLACTSATRALVQDTTDYLMALRHRLEIASAVGAVGAGGGGSGG